MIRLSNKPQLKETIYTINWLLEQDADPELSNRADNIVRLFNELVIRELKNRAQILDVGCGAGITVNALYEAGYQATGIDSQLINILYCRRHKKGEFIKGDNNTLPPGAYYDAVTATHILEHTADPDDFIKQLRAVTRPGGYIYISVPNLAAYSERSLWRKSVANLINCPDHLWAFMPQDLLELFNHNDIEVLFIETQTPTHFIINGIARTIYRAIKRKTLSIDSADVNTPLISKRKQVFFIKIFRLLGKIINLFRVFNYGDTGIELTIVGRKPVNNKGGSE